MSEQHDGLPDDWITPGRDLARTPGQQLPPAAPAPAQPLYSPPAPAPDDWITPGAPPQTLSAPTGTEAPIRETGTGVPVGMRAALGFKSSPEGEAAYLEHYYGRGNVQTDPAGALYFRPSADAPFEPVRGTGGFTLGMTNIGIGDVAEYLPHTALEAAPIAAAGTNPLTVGLAGAAGNVARQAVGWALPGEENIPLEQRGLSAADAMAMAGGSQGLLNRGMQGLDYLRPSNIAGRFIRGAADTPAAAAAGIVERDVQVPLSLGQLTGSRAALMAEGVARRYAPSMDMMNTFDRDQMLNITGRVNDLIAHADRTGWGPEELGNNVANTFTGAVTDQLNIRRAAAVRDFGIVNALAPGQGVIQPNHILSTIDQLIQDYSGPGGGDASAALAQKLRALRAEYSGSPGTPGTPTRYVNGQVQWGTPGTPPSPPQLLTGQQVNRLLQIYGNASAGTGQIFKDIDTAQQRGIARQVQTAIGDDLDDAVNAGGQPGNVATALRTARDNYRGNSAALNNLDEMTLGRLLNRPSQTPPVPEDITKAMMNMKPSQLRATMTVLDARNPNIRGSLQAQFLNDALDAATKGAETPTEALIPGAAPQGPRFSFTAFKNALPEGRIRDEVFGTDPQVQHDLTQLGRWMTLASQSEGAGSPTAPLNWMLGGLKQLFRLHLPEALETIASGLGSRRIARAMTTPEGREAMINMTQNQGITGPVMNKAIHSMAYLYGLNEMEPEPANVRPVP